MLAVMLLEALAEGNRFARYAQMIEEMFTAYLSENFKIEDVRSNLKQVIES